MRSRYSLVISLAVCPRSLLAWYCLVEAAPISQAIPAINGFGLGLKQQRQRKEEVVSQSVEEYRLTTVFRRENKGPLRNGPADPRMVNGVNKRSALYQRKGQLV